MIKRFLLSLLVLVGVLVIMPKDASADMQSSQGSTSSQMSKSSQGNTLRHAYKPFKVQENNWTRARVNNMTNQAVKRLVCVEARNNSTWVNSHLGCLWVDLAPMGSDQMWAMEFDVPTANLTPGNYTLMYSYQETDSSWHSIKSMNLSILNGHYSS